MYHIGMTQWIVGDEPLEISCRRMHDCGYDGIEFAADPYHLDVDECLRLMDKYELNCRSLCGLYSEDRDLTDGGEIGKNAVQYIKDSAVFAHKVGAKVIIVVPSPVSRTVMPAGATMEQLTNNAVKNLREAADFAQEQGVQLAIEAINRYETYYINTLDKAMDLAARVDHPAVGVMADLFHMNLEERSIPDGLEKVKDRLLHVHIADNTREAAGLGSTDFREALRTLKRIGYQGSLAMEFMYRLADPYSAQGKATSSALMDHFAKQSIDYIRMIERIVDDETGS